jgi:hypothetical protein
MFVHQDPALAPAVTELTTVTPRLTKPREPAPKQLTPVEIKAAQLLALDEELGEARVAAYRARMKKELEEIRYRQWRDLQPEWEGVAQNVPQKTKTSGPQSGAALKGPLAGAAAVAAGTAGLRFQLNEIQDQLNGEDSSGGEDSGIGDFFSGLF